MIPETAPLFTVVTPTYNRVHLLPRLYESLRRQTYRDFEWVVVDDGSTDGTAALVNTWRNSGSPLPIRYLHQANAGKCAAMNHGVREARGSLIAQIDSDDELLPDALQTLEAAWRHIAPSERERFVGVTGLCVDEEGRIIGNRYPSDAFISDSLESRYRFKVRGEKWGFQRKDVLLKFPFPEDFPTRHIPEGIVWSEIARRFRTLYINSPLRIYHSNADQITRRPPAASAWYWLISHTHALNADMDYFRYSPFAFWKSAVQYGRASLHLRHRLCTQWRGLRAPARLLWLAALPLAWLVYLIDMYRERSAG